MFQPVMGSTAESRAFDLLLSRRWLVLAGTHEHREQPALKNKQYFGDNLGILRKSVAEESVDLICLDPPFNSNASYNVLFKEKSGEQSAAQITAFEDTWH